MWAAIRGGLANSIVTHTSLAVALLDETDTPDRWPASAQPSGDPASV